MPSWLSKLAIKADRHWTRTVLLGVGVPLTIGYAVWAALASEPPLIGALDKSDRGLLYSSLATTAAALLGFSITALAILFALPQKEIVERMRLRPAWLMLHGNLLTAAGLLAATLFFSTVSLGLDTGKDARVWLEVLTTAAAVSAFLLLLVGGTAFAIVVMTAAMDDSPGT